MLPTVNEIFPELREAKVTGSGRSPTSRATPPLITHEARERWVDAIDHAQRKLELERVDSGDVLARLAAEGWNEAMFLADKLGQALEDLLGELGNTGRAPTNGMDRAVKALWEWDEERKRHERQP